MKGVIVWNAKNGPTKKDVFAIRGLLASDALMLMTMVISWNANYNLKQKNKEKGLGSTSPFPFVREPFMLFYERR